MNKFRNSTINLVDLWKTKRRGRPPCLPRIAVVETSLAKGDHEKSPLHSFQNNFIHTTPSSITVGKVFNFKSGSFIQTPVLILDR